MKVGDSGEEGTEEKEGNREVVQREKKEVGG